MSLSRVQKAAIIALVLIVLIGEGAILVYWGHGDWQKRVSFVLDIIGFYGIGLGFVSHSEAFGEVKFIFKEMTSPNLFSFIGGNLKFLGVVFLVSSLGVRPGKTMPSVVTSLGGCLFIFLVPLTLLYSIFHILVIMPITYASYVLASALVESVQYSDRDEIAEVTDGATRSKFSIRQIVANNPVEAKGFLIGLPAAILSLVIQFGERFF